MPSPKISPPGSRFRGTKKRRGRYHPPAVLVGFLSLCGFAWLMFPFKWTMFLQTEPIGRTSSTRSYHPVIHPRTPAQSVTAILPVTKGNIGRLDALLSPFMSPDTSLAEVIIACPEDLVLEIRRSLQRVVATIGKHGHPEFSLRSWPQWSSEGSTDLVSIISHVGTPWTLVMDEVGLQALDEGRKCALLNPPVVDLPFGANGRVFVGNGSAWSFEPPFVAPTSSLVSRSGELPGLHPSLEWERDVSVGWCGQGSYENESEIKILPRNKTHDRGVVAFVTSNQSSLPGEFYDIPCKLAEQGNLVYHLMQSSEKVQTSPYPPCASRIFTSFGDPVDLLKMLQYTPDLVFVIATDSEEKIMMHLTLQHPQYSRTTTIDLPFDDLKYSSWIGSLSVQELRKWNMPRLDLSIITKDRPQSLARLLSSLEGAMLFGDRLSLRVNLEQSADLETLRIVDDFKWPHGDVFVHHRVVQGGLMPAVVESWYPHSNDTYGLLLEDDVELSPLFYVWVKMAILRYRYGERANRSPKLFGISFYQQKNLELLPSGRRPFSAQDVFSQESINPISTPYLSQIPCSWGAVYFPEHWREFHTFLAVRLSEHALPLSDIIVPDVRSNRWVKSWKKFFIELVYLRGYVMLYPNFDDFLSLSTNHLEAGSHVKDRSQEKKDLFTLPLMRLGKGGELLSGALPELSTLPVLNLTGVIRSLESLEEEGVQRRRELFNCFEHRDVPYDVRDLMCLKP